MEFGHYARECPNESNKKLNCILCGKENHDAFSCTEKLCFKCNKVGHKANMCFEKDIAKCNKCQMTGHKESRCLKVWTGNYPSKTMNQYARCMECNLKGHFKCTSERDSLKINLVYSMKGDLDEFSEDEIEQYGADSSFDYIDIDELRKKSGITIGTGKENGKKPKSKKKVIDNTNVYMEVPNSGSE